MLFFSVTYLFVFVFLVVVVVVDVVDVVVVVVFVVVVGVGVGVVVVVLVLVLVVVICCCCWCWGCRCRWGWCWCCCCCLVLVLLLFLFLLLLFVVVVGVGVVVVVLVVFSFFQSEPLSSTFRLAYQLVWDSSRRISVLCSTHTVAIRFAPAHFRACPVPTVDNTSKCSTNFHGFLLTQLDDGWPESVEEQGLLLFVLRHYITRQYIKDVV